ncbi:MAG: hypothetical protein AAB350_03270 [Patescibacteria group bacterium]
MDLVPNILSKFSFSGNSVAGLILFLVAAFTAVASLVMFFHWKKYGMGGAALALMELLYIGVSAVLIVTAFLTIN